MIDENIAECSDFFLPLGPKCTTTTTTTINN